jgi:xylulokinase
MPRERRNVMSERRSELLIGVDLGTGSSKGVLARPDGEVVATAERMHELSLPRPGWAEHDAEKVWWKDFTEICAELLESADGPVAGVCISGIGPVLLPAGEGGRPLRPGILYGIDTRASKEVAELTEKYLDQKVIEACGNPMTAQSVGPKILWLRRNEPEVWEETRYFFMSHTFCAYRLTGAYVLDHLSASMCEPLYNPRTNSWIEDWVDDIAPGLQMPELRWSQEAAGVVTQEASEATGLPAGIPVAVGTTDAFSEALSVGVKDPGEVMFMYGSTLVVVEITGQSLPSPNLWSNAHLFEGTSNLAGGMSTSGSLTDWVRKISGDKSFAELTQEAAAVAAGSDGLVVLPYFAGERTPISDPDARGVICGLTLSHGRGHLYRAMLEATAFGTRHLLEAMHDAGGVGRRFVAVGGGTKGGLWTQIISDAAGITQQLPKQTIGASYGDALLAAMVSGLADQNTTWVSMSDTVEPNPNNRGLYDELYAVYKDLYPATRPMAHTLASIQLR